MGEFYTKSDKRINGTANYVNKKYMLLVAGILETAEYDLKCAIKKRNYSKSTALKKWFLSQWGQALSGNNGQLIIDRIDNELKKERKKL